MDASYYRNLHNADKRPHPKSFSIVYCIHSYSGNLPTVDTVGQLYLTTLVHLPKATHVPWTRLLTNQRRLEGSNYDSHAILNFAESANLSSLTQRNFEVL